MLVTDCKHCPKRADRQISIQLAESLQLNVIFLLDTLIFQLLSHICLELHFPLPEPLDELVLVFFCVLCPPTSPTQPCAQTSLHKVETVMSFPLAPFES